MTAPVASAMDQQTSSHNGSTKKMDYLKSYQQPFRALVRAGTIELEDVHSAMSDTATNSGSDPQDLVIIMSDESGFSSDSQLLLDNNIPVLACALLAALCTGGPTYAFGLYGAALKEDLHLTQSQLGTISSSNFCAGLLSWIPGLVVDRYGPRTALALSGVLQAFFLMLYWLVSKQIVVLFPVVPTLCLLGILFFMANSLAVGSTFKLLVETMSAKFRGSAVGAAKGFLGLGSGVYACLFQALRDDATSDLDFLPMAAILALCGASLPALLLLPQNMAVNKSNCLRTRPKHDKLTKWHLRVVYMGLLGLVLAVAGSSLKDLSTGEAVVEGADHLEKFKTSNYSRAFFICLCWYGPILALLFLPAHQDETLGMNDHEETTRLWQEDDKSQEEEIEQEVPIRKMNIGTASERSTATEPGDDHNLLEMLSTKHAWLFAWNMVLLCGGGTIMTNNMGQMVEALDFPLVAVSASLAVFSVAQATSRVAIGAVSDWALSTGIPRPAFFIVASLASAAAHLVLAVATSEGVFVTGVALAGVAFGMIWPLMVLIIGEVFGTTNMGSNYLFYDGLSLAVGTLSISKFLAGAVYDSHIDVDSPGSDGRTCYGPECFGVSHLIVAVLSLTCVFASLAKTRLTRSAYAMHMHRT